MIAAVGSRIAILLFGTLYPAYASYKAVRNKDVKAYVTWMMYWIVFALFTCIETLSDVFLSFWVPFYYEMKVVLVLWLLSPATKGSSFLYRKFVHPTLTEREKEIDEYLAKMKEKSYSTMVELGSKGINYALQTAIKGGGGLVNQLKKSYSLGDLNEEQVDAPRRRAIKNEVELTDDEDDEVQDEQRVAHRGYAPRRTQSGSSRVDMYFSAVDVNVRQRGSHTGDATNNNLAVSKAASTLSADVDVEEMEVDGLMRAASVNSRPRTRRSVSNSGPKAPSGRPKSTVLTSSVTDVLEAGFDNSTINSSLLDPFSNVYIQSDEPNFRKSTVIIEEIEDDESDFSLNDNIDPDLAKKNKGQSCESEDLKAFLPEVILKDLEEDAENFFEAENIENMEEEEEPKKPLENDIQAEVLPSEITGKPEGEIEIQKKEIITSKEPEAEITDSPSEEFQESLTNEIINKELVVVSEDEHKEEKIECITVVRDETEKSADAAPAESQDQVVEIISAEKKEDSPDVVMKVEVCVSEDNNLGQTSIIKMSLESLPTSSQAAEEIQKEFDEAEQASSSLGTSRNSLVVEQESRCSTPSSPKAEGRAGRYNKRPAPPRPTEKSPDEEGPLKARLVLKPGVVRQLPEDSVPSVFLHEAKEKKKFSKEGKSSLLSFWHAKPEKSELKEASTSSKKMTDL
ncbi:muscle M-line assembly protein unc-89-like isoform X2 [Neocloeon triangulifer]|uniref:muscle M-line assembly protein unc-89-like isoform X2 n=1 Tax=Neocloeon triangulifer TaxID=2078957 RepID=UPI00286F17AA|nr:muscle M-line assembly protein unc-89-like isoform X2 [Neocloeon triangulifer]